MRLPENFVQFVKMLRKRANGRAIIGWGMSRGAKWLIELVREHAGLLDGAVMFAGYPQTRCPYDQRASAQELIAARNCLICMVHFVGDQCCGVSCYPHWHAEFERHMAPSHRQSSLVSLTMPGNMELPIDMMWRALVPAQ